MFSQIWQKPIHVSVFRTRCSWALSERKIEQRSLFCPSSTCLEEVLSCAVMLDASFKLSMQPEWPTWSYALPYMFWRIRKNFWQQLELFWETLVRWLPLDVIAISLCSSKTSVFFSVPCKAMQWWWENFVDQTSKRNKNDGKKLCWLKVSENCRGVICFAVMK